MCLVADPEKMPQVRNDFLRENELGFQKYKYAFWDAPRIAIPAIMMIGQLTGHSLFAVQNSNWFIQFLTGTSQVVEGTAMTFVGIATAVVLSIVNVVNAIVALVGTYVVFEREAREFKSYHSLHHTKSTRTYKLTRIGASPIPYSFSKELRENEY